MGHMSLTKEAPLEDLSPCLKCRFPHHITINCPRFYHTKQGRGSSAQGAFSRERAFKETHKNFSVQMLVIPKGTKHVPYMQQNGEWLWICQTRNLLDWSEIYQTSYEQRLGSFAAVDFFAHLKMFSPLQLYRSWEKLHFYSHLKLSTDLNLFKNWI